jgi:hypothetical protein
VVNLYSFVYSFVAIENADGASIVCEGAGVAHLENTCEFPAYRVHQVRLLVAPPVAAELPGPEAYPGYREIRKSKPCVTHRNPL